MAEKDWDSSVFDYEVIYETEKDKKKLKWDMAIGLQKVDNLTPSKYLEELLDKNITNEMTLDDVKDSLKQYYLEKSNEGDLNYNELECDFVSSRIVELLDIDNFELSINYLKYVHKFLFQDVYEFAGEFRKVDILKNELILNNDSISYSDYTLIEESLKYVIYKESLINYKNINPIDFINNIVIFTSDIWQVHPFREGNTRTTAVFIEKYLNKLGYNVDNTMFKEKSIYFRNALVRSNYSNKYLNIKKDSSYLLNFFENLLFGKNNELSSENLIVEELFKK